MLTVHCPKCDSTDIREKNVAYADLPVTAWELDDDGEARPAEYDSDVDTEWFFEENDPAPYVCKGCNDWEGDCDELVVRNDEEEAA